jgi:hypothetical protein
MVVTCHIGVVYLFYFNIIKVYEEDSIHCIACDALYER